MKWIAWMTVYFPRTIPVRPFKDGGNPSLFSAAEIHRCHSLSHDGNWIVSHRPLLGRQWPAILDLSFLFLEIQPLFFERLLHLPMPRVEFLLRLLQLGFLFLHLLLENHLHLGFHLGELGFVKYTLFLHAQGGAITINRKIEKKGKISTVPYLISLKTLESCATPMLSSFSVRQFS